MTARSSRPCLTAMAAALLGLACAGGAHAQAASTPAGAATTTTTTTAGAHADSKLSHGDRKFVEFAGQAGLAEVAAGQLAQQKAANEQVKQFGARMVQDHTKANDELKQLAGGKGVNLPTEPDRKHRHEADKLQKLSGAEFDRAFMKQMVEDHKKVVSEFEKHAKDAKDADVKAFASKTLPALREHLQMAQSLNDSVKPTK